MISRSMTSGFWDTWANTQTGMQTHTNTVIAVIDVLLLLLQYLPRSQPYWRRSDYALLVMIFEKALFSHFTGHESTSCINQNELAQFCKMWPLSTQFVAMSRGIREQKRQNRATRRQPYQARRAKEHVTGVSPCWPLNSRWCPLRDSRLRSRSIFCSVAPRTPLISSCVTPTQRAQQYQLESIKSTYDMSQ